MASVKQSSFTQLMYSINSITEGYVLICMSASIYNNTYAGADPGFQVRETLHQFERFDFSAPFSFTGVVHDVPVHVDSVIRRILIFTAISM
jgi:hypothetical protein